MANITPINKSLSIKLGQYIAECERYRKPIDKSYANSILKEAAEYQINFDASYSMEREFVSILETVRYIEKQHEDDLINPKNHKNPSNAIDESGQYSVVALTATSILTSSNPFINLLNRLEEARLMKDAPALTLAIIDICQGKSCNINQRDLLHTASQYSDTLLEFQWLPIIIPNEKELTTSSKDKKICSSAFLVIIESIASAIEKIQPSLKFK